MKERMVRTRLRVRASGDGAVFRPGPSATGPAAGSSRTRFSRAASAGPWACAWSTGWVEPGGEHTEAAAAGEAPAQYVVQGLWT